MKLEIPARLSGSIPARQAPFLFRILLFRFKQNHCRRKELLRNRRVVGSNPTL